MKKQTYGVKKPHLKRVIEGWWECFMVYGVMVRVGSGSTPREAYEYCVGIRK